MSAAGHGHGATTGVARKTRERKVRGEARKVVWLTNCFRDAGSHHTSDLASPVAKEVAALRQEVSRLHTELEKLKLVLLEGVGTSTAPEAAAGHGRRELPGSASETVVQEADPGEEKSAPEPHTPPAAAELHPPSATGDVPEDQQDELKTDTDEAGHGEQHGKSKFVTRSDFKALCDGSNENLAGLRHFLRSSFRSRQLAFDRLGANGGENIALDLFHDHLALYMNIDKAEQSAKLFKAIDEQLADQADNRATAASERDCPA